jgi:putative transposase
MRSVRRRYPFAIDAIVVLPEHLHVLMTLPEADADLSIRWSLIKRLFSRTVSEAGVPVVRRARGELALWQRVSGSIPSAMIAISSGMSTTSTTTR